MKIEKITVEEHINTHFKSFSYYTLGERGIPSKYDSLINVSRIIMLSTPENLTKTTSVIGNCYKNGYKHGDSIAGAIARLCRDYDNSMSLLVGDGFFGNYMSPPSAPRYTSMKISKDIKEMISKYMPVNEKNQDGTYRFLKMDYPLGLCLTITGIGEGYRSQILPRKFSEIKKYIDTGKGNLKPYFQKFKGEIKKIKKNGYLISSKIEIDGDTIAIKDVPPMSSFDTVINKLKEKLDDPSIKSFDYDVGDTFTAKVKVDINEVDRIHKMLMSIFSVKYYENYVFVDEDGVIEYSDIKDYLDDFRILRNHYRLDLLKYELSKLQDELSYLSSKKLFMEYMLETGRHMSNKKVDEWLNRNIKNKEHVNKLKSIRLLSVTKENYDNLVKIINSELPDKIENKNKEIEELKCYLKQNKTKFKGELLTKLS